jgi:SAM-dependent methyltransferase
VGGVCARKMTPKKAHEVSRMAGVVAEVCRNTGCSIVLDIGSGLGYLGGVLRQRCGLKVVGVEREGERVAAARRRAPSLVSTLQLDISDSHHCQTQLSSLLDDIIREEGGGRVCLVGLHCCGDLTPNILRMVSGQVHPDLCATVVVSCCYHKMSSRDSDVGFNCFPISAHLRDSCPDLCEKMSVFGLRLASQETRARSFFRSLSRSLQPLALFCYTIQTCVV